MQNVPNNFPGVTYRTGPEGWIDSLNMIAWLRELCMIKPLQNGKIWNLFINYCSVHNLTERIIGAAEAIRTNLDYFPHNKIELVQPGGSLVIQKIKAPRRKFCDNLKRELINADAWTKGGNLSNPGQTFFLKWLPIPCKASTMWETKMAYHTHTINWFYVVWHIMWMVVGKKVSLSQNFKTISRNTELSLKTLTLNEWIVKWNLLSF